VTVKLVDFFLKTDLIVAHQVHELVDDFQTVDPVDSAVEHVV